MQHTSQQQSLQKLILWADNNHLSPEHFPRDIATLLSLKKLNLHDKNLTSIPPEIGLLKNLEELYLSYNQLVEIPKVKSLEVLWLMGNQLYTLPDTIYTLPYLRDLIVFENRMKNVSEKLFNMPRLEYILLHDNHLDALAKCDTFLSKINKYCTHALHLATSRINTWPVCA